MKRRGRALITAWVFPCKGRTSEPVKLLRGGKHIDTRHLDRACTFRFRPRIRHGASFRATVSADTSYLAATSRPLKIRISHPWGSGTVHRRERGAHRQGRSARDAGCRP